MSAIDLTKILEPYEEQWVALTPDKTKVIGSGDTLSEVVKKSKKKSCESPVFLKVPSLSKGYAG